jgi:hypothetical protein
MWWVVYFLGLALAFTIYDVLRFLLVRETPVEVEGVEGGAGGDFDVEPFKVM